MEYEYSFKVSRLDKYIEYCENNSYKKISQKYEKVIIFRNINKTIARITFDNEKIYLDFKEDKLSNNVLNERKETPKIIIDNYNDVLKILNFLEYKEDNTLERNRIVYEKNNVIFEFDSYILPEKAYVVSLEGDKVIVDKIYNEIMNL